MALATQCPHCHTTFRVASDQLKLRGGIVRCGACQRIFDGSAHLIDLEALAAKKASEAAQAGAGLAAPAAAPPVIPSAASSAEPEPALPAAAQASVAPATAYPAPDSPAADTPALDAPDATTAPSASSAPEPAADAGAQPVYTLDFDHTFDPFGILPKADPALGADADAAGFAPPAPLGAGTPDRIEPRLDVAAEEDAGAPLIDEGVRDAPEATSATGSPAPEPEPAPGLQAGPAPGSLAASTPGPAPAAAIESLTAPEPALPATDSPAPAYAPAGRIEPSFDLPVDEALVAQPLPGHEPDLEPDFGAHPEPQQTPADTGTHTEPADASASALPAQAAEAEAETAPDTRAAVASTPSAALPLRASADHNTPPAASDARQEGQAPRSARAKAVDARTRRSKLTPTRIEAPRLRVPASSESDEPEFVKRSRRQERSGKAVRILMAVGAAALLLLLAAQLLIAYRSELALRYPAARGLLNGLCAAAGCRVDLPAKAENLVIDEGELAPIGADTYSLNTTLRNQGSLMQAWPSIELELTDANNKPLLRRVFGPADYLPEGATGAAGAAGAAGTAAASGFGAHSEQPVRLNFALADIKPSGYHTFVFYP